MKYTIAILTVLALVLGHTEAAAGDAVNCYTVKSKKWCKKAKAEALPTSVNQFIKMRDRLSTDPWGGAQMFLYALMVRLDDKQLADKMLVLSLAADQVQKGGKDIYKGYSWKSRWTYHIENTKKYDYCVRSYASGSSPKNDYALNSKNVAIWFRKQTSYNYDRAKGKYKVFACSSGTSTCRPITLTRNKKGIWKVTEFSSVLAGCRKPEKAPADNSDEL